MARWTVTIAILLGLAAAGTPARAQQSTTYHLHNEASLINSANKQLKTVGPDSAQTVLRTANLKGHAGNSAKLIAYFETQSGVPGRTGTIQAGSTVTLTLRMRVTALPSSGSLYPYAIVRLNSASGQLLCVAGGQNTPVAALTTTLAWYTFSCTTSSAISMVSSDRFFLEAHAWLAGTVGNKNLYGELAIETGADSTVVIPNPGPSITSLSVTAGYVGQAVTISGTGLGQTQGSSTVTFNGISAAATSWSEGSIATSVPPGATTGPVVVTVGSVPSNSVAFTVVPHITGVNPPGAAVGEPVTISGTSFGPTQGSSTVTFNGTAATPTSWSDTSIGVPVPAGATTGPLVVTVASNASNAVSFTVITTGALTGTITRASNGAALAGATVQAVLLGLVKGTATSGANGTYSIGTLDPGTYDVRVHATGFSSEVRGGTTISANLTTTVDVAMSQPGSISGTVTQSDGTTPISGAAVAVHSGPFQKGTASTNASGAYSIPELHPGSYVVQAASVGYRTREQAAVVNENATTTANLSLDAAATGPVLYAYDALGRLIQVTDPAGDSAIYRYDAVGNITAIERPGSGGASPVAISGLSRTSGPIGASVTVYGTGFGAVQGTSTITFNGTSAIATSWSSTAIGTTVPAGAATGSVIVTVNGQPSNGAAFTVTAAGAGAPTITEFTPTIVAAGDSITVTGTGFDATAANNRLTVNVPAAQVTSASATTLQATVPVTTTGRLSLLTQNGSTTSANYLWVAPAPFTVPQVESTGSIAYGVPTAIPVNTAGSIAMRAFEGTQGHRASASLASGNFSAGGTLSIYSVYANPTSTGFTGSGFLEPVSLSATGTYTVLLDPNGTGTGGATVTVYDVPPDVIDPIVPGGASVPVSIQTPGQNARLPFSGIQNNRVCATTAATTTIPSGLLKVLRPDGTTLGAVGFIANFLGFLDTLSLGTTGTYTLMVDPNTTNVGSTTVTLHDVPADTTGSVAINGPPVPVPLAACQNGSLTFSGTQNQQVVVHVTGNNTGESVLVKLLSSDGQTVLAQSLSSATDFNLFPATLPTPGTATYTITIDPSRTGAGTPNISVTLQ